jgi:hypothetical protein
MTLLIICLNFPQFTSAHSLQPLGCDGKLGSSMKEDKCGVCDGDQSTCKTVAGLFDERNLSPGYHDIIVLPVGATAIRVEEMRPTTNSLG